MSPLPHAALLDERICAELKRRRAWCSADQLATALGRSRELDAMVAARRLVQLRRLGRVESRYRAEISAHEWRYVDGS